MGRFGFLFADDRYIDDDEYHGHRLLFLSDNVLSHALITCRTTTHACNIQLLIPVVYAPGEDYIPPREERKTRSPPAYYTSQKASSSLSIQLPPYMTPRGTEAEHPAAVRKRRKKQTGRARARLPKGILGLGGAGLLGRDPLFHLPPRLEDHLVPPPLQRRLPLVAVRAPRLALLVLLPGLVLGELVVQVVARDEVRLRGLGGLFRRGARCGRRGAADGRGRLEGDGGLVRRSKSARATSHQVALRKSPVRAYPLNLARQDPLGRGLDVAPVALQVP